MSWEVYSHFHKAKGVIRACVIGVALSLILMGLRAVQAQDRAFQFGLMGDTGYTTEDIEGFKGLLAAVNKADLSFVVHVGDFENDGRAYTRNPSAGTNALYRRKLQSRLQFLSIRQASVHSDAW